MTTNVLKRQITTSINNLHLKGTIDESLTPNSTTLFGSNTDGAIPIATVGLYQIINKMIDILLDIKNKDKVVRPNLAPFYNNSIKRYSLKNREKQLINILNKAPKVTIDQVKYVDLSSTIDYDEETVGKVKCKIKYNNNLYDGSGTPYYNANSIVSLQTPTGDKNFKIVVSGADSSSLEFNRGSDANDTAENLRSIINAQTEFTATINTTAQIITVTQNNTDGIILPNTQYNPDVIAPILNFSPSDFQGITSITNFAPLRYTQYIANTRANTSFVQRRGNNANNDTKLTLLISGYNNGVPIKKYSEDALFEFFGRMNYEFIKLNYNHIGKEEHPPGWYKIATGSNNISTHHLNSVVDYTNSITNLQNKIRKDNFIKVLDNIKKTGHFGGTDIKTTSNSFISQYSYFNKNLFDDSTDAQNIPFRDDDTKSLGLYQLIDDLILQLSILKKNIKQKEKYFINILRTSDVISLNNLEYIELNNEDVNNLKASNSYCKTQGGLIESSVKPTFIRIFNETDYSSSIDYKYSQDALYELCGKWCNELLKLNNGHSGNEDIYPGFYNTNNNAVSQHHMNSVIDQ